MAMAELCPLAEELSCSICLEPFKGPVTTPCGHNFCGSCLDQTWAVQGPPYLCPQCRTGFQTRPQLHKNTVLCAVVEQFLQAEQVRPELPDDWTPPTRAAAPNQADQVPCDHCLKAAAVKTCLVCTVSFCQEHLRPHLDSPAFRDHPLQPPIRDLMRRKCPQHNRLRDFFCPEHGECICHICVVEHKTCSPAPLSQASTDLENKLRHKLTVMYSQINGASRALEDVRARQQDVRKAAKLQGITTKPVYVPRVELNHELIKGVCQGTSELKNELKQYLKQLQDKKPEELIIPGGPGGHDLPHMPKPPRPVKKIPSKEYRPSGHPVTSPTHASPPSAPILVSASKLPTFGAPEHLVDLKQTGQEAEAKVPARPLTPVTLKAKVLETFLAKSRPELLEYTVKVVLDYRTAHNKVTLSEDYTVASVANVPQNYQSHPQRFTCCSQVLGLHCYKKGIHYWEVELQKNNFCGVGVCYGSMERQGHESRLGRNSASWCVEWFNTKISAWHNNVEKTLPSTKASRVGVLLNCDHGFVIFFAVADKVHLLYKYKVDFTEALYPAFWLFTTGATLSICSSK
ncbi:hypothetical protein DBR06_SOUSAS2810017 [Sousa chinensis]|uniref:E3 ubiquitin/ISG15 ligase TRIM25 n=1 Tax=Sousa chinensis TaxID=103600 RepID=A0A484GHY6_SOUCH|nr:hypothetical protein DBR06_SOUSAS2810017 [Sousa chinensis]